MRDVLTLRRLLEQHFERFARELFLDTQEVAIRFKIVPALLEIAELEVRVNPVVAYFTDEDLELLMCIAACGVAGRYDEQCLRMVTNLSERMSRLKSLSAFFALPVVRVERAEGGALAAR